MAIKGDQRKAFNDALKTVEKSNKEIIELYKTALKSINQKLADFKLKVDKGLLSPGIASQKRLEKLAEEINDNIQKLYFVQGDIITSGWTKNYIDTYYQISFAIEKEININTLPAQGASFNYNVNYAQINPAFVRSQLNTIVGGMTFKDRQQIDKFIMQGKVRDIINNAVIEGLSPKQVAKQLKMIDEVYAQNASKALTTARTELLRAYSVSAEESWQIAQDSGIEGVKVWDATLDGRTRPQHARMDQKKADEKGLFRMPNGEITLGPRMPGLSAGNSVNCRCRSAYLPDGVKPNTRGFRTDDGDWLQTYGDMDYNQWSKTLLGQSSIEKTKIDRLERAKRLKAKREQKS